HHPPAGHAGDSSAGVVADDDGLGPLRCQVACAALQTLPATAARPSAAGLRAPPDAVVLYPAGRLPAPEPPFPRAA
ncbi:MAG: hypothetical protein ACK5YI_08390, partial [Rhodospirillales bacterium]